MDEETRKYFEYMNEFDTVEIETPNRMMYAFKWLAHEMYGDESCTDVLFIEMLRNTADKFGKSIPELAGRRYQFMEVERRNDEYRKRLKKE